MDYDTMCHEIVTWIRTWFSENGPDAKAVIGISGGKDSTVVAALCVEALGKDRVIGVQLPAGVQHDIEDSNDVIQFLGIQSYCINIGPAIDTMMNAVEAQIGSPSKQTTVNLPARIRMSYLYAISQSVGGRVSNNCNLSENWIGFSTRWGDAAGDFGPLRNLTTQEIRGVAGSLGLPHHLIHKVPIDGLNIVTDGEKPHIKTDEEVFGFTYEALDHYIRTGLCDDAKVKQRIDLMHLKSRFKEEPIPSWEPIQ
ncbi:NAD(+) synthase [Erysipelothrix sp. HDW6C]|uniref:NAD(+) synthase n=1 Tax=Erysipelothrix sp. HDW6C TaxID=2714930 RepID=UPI00140B944D|nr:NAD(+) synthase [Erysipelothrix sp. HDW6C]QIK70099.1 NAD(+) synthase [Erysipelothrix sp. HDW6C]